jgi:hypothetical protein
MVLEDLKKSISKMPTEELMGLILELRASRRARKEKPAAKKAAAKSDASLDKAITALNPEQRRKLLELLGDKS